MTDSWRDRPLGRSLRPGWSRISRVGCGPARLSGAGFPATANGEKIRLAVSAWFHRLALPLSLLAHPLLSAGSDPEAAHSCGLAGRQPERARQEEKAVPESIPISVVATANLTERQGEIRFVNPLERATATKPPKEAAATLRVRAGDGRVLGDHPVEVKLSSELSPEDDRVGIVDAVITVSADARSIELLFGERVADAFAVGGALPAVRGLRVTDAGEEAVRLTLDLDTPIKDHQSYSVQVSTDNGQTWQTVGVGLKDRSVTLDRSQFHEGQEVRVRVVATNGLTSSVVATETFRVWTPPGVSGG